MRCTNPLLVSVPCISAVYQLVELDAGCLYLGKHAFVYLPKNKELASSQRTCVPTVDSLTQSDDRKSDDKCPTDENIVSQIDKLITTCPVAAEAGDKPINQSTSYSYSSLRSYSQAGGEEPHVESHFKHEEACGGAVSGIQIFTEDGKSKISFIDGNIETTFSLTSVGGASAQAKEASSNDLVSSSDASADRDDASSVSDVTISQHQWDAAKNVCVAELDRLGISEAVVRAAAKFASPKPAPSSN